jgi:hypothetical protein
VSKETLGGAELKALAIRFDKAIRRGDVEDRGRSHDSGDGFASRENSHKVTPPDVRGSACYPLTVQAELIFRQRV